MLSCPFRPDIVSDCRNDGGMVKETSVWGDGQVAGFEVFTSGRFWGVHRGA